MKKVLSLIVIFVLGALNAQAQWEQSNGPYGGYVLSLVQSGKYLYAGTRFGAYRSSDNGDNWQSIGLDNLYVPSLIHSGNYLYAGTSDGVYRSSDNGDNWQSSGLDNQSVNSLIQSGNYLYAGTDVGGVYRSSDNGDNWQSIGLDNQSVNSLIQSGNYLYAGTWDGVYRSSDNGGSWQRQSIGLDNQSVYSLVQSGNYLYAGTMVGGVYRSSDNGDNWQSIGLDNRFVYSLIQSGNYLYAGTLGGGIYRSSDNGDNWQSIGLDNRSVYSLIQSGNYLYAGTDDKVWRLPIESSPSELVSPVDQATDIGLTPEFRWTHEQGIDNYALWVYTDRTNPTSRVVEVIVPAKDYLVGEEIIYRTKEVLQTEKRYYWQVRKNKDDGEMIGENSFTTGKTPNSADDLMIGGVSYGLNILRTYPNPSEGTLTIEIEDVHASSDIYDVVMYDMYGRNVGIYQIHNKQTIDLNSIPVGQYQLQVRNAQTQSIFAPSIFSIMR
jgi:photosystem II stability/assembly factor-like uncharacterized protein